MLRKIYDYANSKIWTYSSVGKKREDEADCLTLHRSDNAILILIFLTSKNMNNVAVTFDEKSSCCNATYGSQKLWYKLTCT